MKPLPCPTPAWPRFSALLDQALALAPEDRGRWLEALAGDDAALAAPLREVLERQQPLATGGWLEHPQFDAVATAFQAGQSVGPWRLLRPLGSGGMGEVWLAARDDGAYQRDVALKLPHAHLLAGALRERFARERNILAGLAHPNIARFYDAGLDAGHQPWLALEYVDGAPITEHCRRHALSVPARVALVRQVASAVQAAHARLVVHRDLKPANVLVTDAGQVRLLDFGIAKLLDDDTPGAGLTEIHGRAATPDYAAPEQIGRGEVTVATDVFALGVMLFELLAEVRPWAGDSGPGRMLRERGEAPLASSRAQGERRAALRGDLDAILAKALDPAPAARYASMEAFAADLDRYLAHQPVQARRIGRLQRLGKFVRRHRSGVAVAAAMALLLLAGVGGVLWQAQRAQAQARRAEAVKDFLVDIFRANDPRIASDAPRGTVTAKTLLDASVPRIEGQFEADPVLQIELLRTVADLYAQIGEDQRYEELQQRQVALAIRHFGPDHPNVIDAAVESAMRACLSADADLCVSRQAEARRGLDRMARPDPHLEIVWWLGEGRRLQRLPEEADAAERAFRKAVELGRQQAPRSTALVTALNELGGFLGAQRQDQAAAIGLYREAVALSVSLPERNDAELQTIHGNLGLAHQQLGLFAEAAVSFQAAAEIADRTVGPESPLAWVPRSHAARTLHLSGQREAAHREFDRLLPLLAPDDDSVDATSVRALYGDRLASEGRPERAIPYLEAAVAGFSRQSAYSFQHPLAQRYLGDAYAASGRSAQARELLEASLAAYLAQDVDASQPVMAIRERWGRFLLESGEPDAARSHFETVLSNAGERPLAHRALAQAGLARVWLAAGDLPRAHAASQGALAVWAQVQGFRDVRMEPYLQRVRADVLAATGDLAAAQALEDAAALASADYDHPDSSTRIRRRLQGPRPP